MSLGVFVQVNEESPKGAACPLGYVIQENGCWDWVGGTTLKGYGHFRVNGRWSMAHRVMYERAKGPIPSGLHLDHLCRNPGCVNPDHLEPVTLRENVLRGVGIGAMNSRKTHCPQGHAYSGERKFPPNSKQKRGRVCRTCENLRLKLWKRRKKNVSR